MGRWTTAKEKRELQNKLKQQRQDQEDLYNAYTVAMRQVVEHLEKGECEKAKNALEIAEHLKSQVEMAGTVYEASGEAIDRYTKTQNSTVSMWQTMLANIAPTLVSAGFGLATYKMQQEALAKAYENDHSGEMVNKRTLGFFENLPNPFKGIPRK